MMEMLPLARYMYIVEILRMLLGKSPQAAQDRMMIAITTTRHLALRFSQLCLKLLQMPIELQ